MQSSGTKDSKVQSFVNSQFQQDVEEMIDLDEQYKLYLKQKEVIQNLEDSLLEKEQELEHIKEEIEDLKEKKEFLMEDEDKEGYQELIEDLSKLKQNKNELELEILSIKKEKNLEMSSLIDFDEKAYQKRLKESKIKQIKNIDLNFIISI